MYEYKPSDVFDFTNFIGAETHQKGDEFQGGETVIDNLQTLCSDCNLGKGDLLL